MPSGDPVPVWVYSDYACPFCYVGDERLRRLGRKVRIEPRWRPLELHPGLPADGLPIEQLGYPPEQWSAMQRAVEEMAEELELPFRLPDFAANSHEALQAAEFAKDLGRDIFRRIHGALFRAYLVEGRNFGRREELLTMAEESGVDREGLESALQDGRYEAELKEARAEAERYGIGGTPTFLFGRYKVVGAAPLPVMEEAAGRAASDQRARQEESGGTEPPTGSGEEE